MNDNLIIKIFKRFDEDLCFKYSVLKDYPKTSKDKFTIIDDDGYLYENSYNGLLKNFKRRSKMDIVSTWNPHSIENIKTWLKLNKDTISLISYNFIKAKSLLKFRCSICGEFESTWDDISHSASGCINCNLNRKYTIEEIKHKIHEKFDNVIVISDNYIDAHSDIVCLCKKHGCQWITTWNRINRLVSGGCRECFHESSYGENSHFWKGGITPLSIYLRCVIGEWKNETMKKCNYKCDVSGKRFDDIHHLYGFNLILDEVVKNLSININACISDYTESELKAIEEECVNLHKKYGLGVCLSNSIHKQFHSIYGYGYNTKEQYYEFKNEYIKNNKL